MNRKRKLTSSGKKPMIGVLRAIGFAAKHPLLIQDFEMKARRQSKSKNELDPMKIICFGGIPACCLHARGSGPTEQIAIEAAANAMIQYFRTIRPIENVDSFQNCRDDDPDQKEFAMLLPVFREFEKAIADNYLSIARVSQFEMTSAAILRGKELKKRVHLNLNDSNVGYIKPMPAAPLRKPPVRGEKEVITLDGDDDVIFEKEEQKPEASKQKEQDDDDVVFLETTSSATPSATPAATPSATPSTSKKSSKTPTPSPKEVSPEVENLRKIDEEHRKFVENELRERRRHQETVVDFGDHNTSRSGPPEVFCATPNVEGEQFEAYSSESEENPEEEDEEEVASKRARIEKEDDVVVHTTTTTTTTSDEPSSGDKVETEKEKEKEKEKDDDEEIGEMVDEWEDEELIEQRKERQRRFLNGHSSLQEFLDHRKLPFNYQMKTIGVVANEQMIPQVETFVSLVTARSMESVKRMSKLTWDHYEHNSQTEEIYNRKMRARHLILTHIQAMFPNKVINLQVTGSTVNGCGSYNSDIDMCLCVPTVSYCGYGFDDFQCERSFSNRTLRKVEKTLRRMHYNHPFKQLVKLCNVVPAKVPIIKLLLNGEFAGLDIDINVNNTAGIYNSHLVHYYSLIDNRFPALALLIKHWAMNTGVSNSQLGYLNSYTIILLVVHYLQCGVRPAVLPNLQYVFPHKFDRKLPLAELLLFGDIASQLPPGPPNTWSLGELLVGFFYYYANFDFQNEAISIRSAQTVRRSCLPRDTSLYPMFVEEPFDAVNTARCVRDHGKLNYIQKEIRKVVQVFSKPKFRLEDIRVNVVSDDSPRRK